MEERERRVTPSQGELSPGGRPENESAGHRERELSYGAGDGLPVLNP